VLPARAEPHSDSKIQQFYEVWPRGVLCENYVVGFQIAMNNPKFVSFMQGVAHLLDNA